MASRVEALQQAGFSDEEVAAWATERRDALTTAGFKENEIDAYFTGGVTAPDKPPQAFIDRVEIGQRLSKITSAVAKEASIGYGEAPPTGFDDKTFNDLIDLGIFHDPAKGRPSPIQFGNEAVLLPLAQGLGAVFRGLSAGVHGAGAFVGELHKGILEYEQEKGGAKGFDPETEGNRLKREVINFGNWALIEAGMGRFSRPRVGPEGVIDEPIGGLPKSADFHNAAKVLTDDTAPRGVQEKLLQTYEQRGVHPAEMAADAQRDPVLHQKLLSKDPQDLPYREPATGEVQAAIDRSPRISLSEILKEGDAGSSPFLTAEGKIIATGGDHLSIANQAERLENNLVRFNYGKNSEGANVLGIDIVKGQQLTDRQITILERLGNKAEVFGDVTDLEGNILSSHKSVKDTLLAAAPDAKATAKLFPEYTDAQKAVLDKISIGERDAKRPWSFDRLYTEAIDDLHPLKAVSEDAYQMARLTRGQFGKAEYFLEHGTFDFGTLKDTGKPLRQILEPVRDDLNPLRAYLASKRAIELEGRGIKSGMPIEEAQVVVKEGAGKFEKMAGELAEYQQATLKYLKDSGMLSDEAVAAMGAVNKHYVPFYRVMAEETGGPKSGSSLGPGNPVKRIKGSDRGIADPLESIIKNTYAFVSIADRNAAGITLIDALQTQGIKVVEKPIPRVKDPEFAKYLSERGIEEASAANEALTRLAHDLIEGKPQEGTPLRAYRNGKRVEAYVNDPELVTAYQGLDRTSAGLLVKIFSVPARTMRAGAVLTPDFMARNLLRDFMTAFVNSKGLFTPADTLSGLYSVLRKDPAWGDWVKSGGANSTMVALDRAYLQESLAKLAGETGLMERSWNVITSPIRGLRFVSELMENATRVGEFKKLAKGEVPKSEMQAAAFASREVTLDFARMGAKMRSYNMLTAFANAQIQGLDRIGRAVIDRPLNTAMKVAGGITLPSVLLWWANHDDPRYQELPHWQKDLFWIIPTDSWEPIDAADAAGKPEHLIRTVNGKTEFNNGSIWRIPKPFELGVIFGSGPERLLDATIGKDKNAFDGFTKSVLEVLTPNMIPTAAQPLMEQFANRSTFIDRTLIPADMEKHLPEYQYTPYTTQLARKLGQVVAAFPGIREASVDPGNPAGPVTRAATSPILIENYVRSWTGGLGVYAMQAADLSLRKAGVLPDPVTPTPTLADIPFVKAFVVRYPSAGMQPVQDFYDDHQKQKAFFDTYMARAQEGDVEAMTRIEEAGGPQMFMRLDAIKQTLSEHSKIIRDIYKNPDIDRDEKRQLIDGLYYSMIEVGRAGRDIQRQVKAPQ